VTSNEDLLEPVQPISPGEYLRKELVARNMSQTELARRMGRPGQAINEIINGKKSVTQETALELEHVLGTPASIWLNLESRYQLAVARVAEDERLEGQAAWLDRFPVHEMEHRKWIQPGTTAAERVRLLLRFFGVASFANWNEHQEALGFRITGNANLDTGALAAWIRRGEMEGRDLATAEYDEPQFRSLLVNARALTRHTPEAGWTRLQRSCAEVGVAAVVVREFPKIGANGVARWLSPQKALIQLNLRYRWADIFWFTFFHEAAHVLMHEPRRIFVELDGNPSRDPHEADADRLAEEILIPAKDWEPFVLRSEFDSSSVREYADMLGIHPGIVVGRLQHVGLVPWRSNLNALRERLEWR